MDCISNRLAKFFILAPDAADALVQSLKKGFSLLEDYKQMKDDLKLVAILSLDNVKELESTCLTKMPQFSETHRLELEAFVAQFQQSMCC